jgi:mono/diheme cytochrome c family protein
MVRTAFSGDSQMIARILCTLICLATSGSALAAEKLEPSKTSRVDFARDVYPIFRRSCIECHGPEKQEAELRLDQRVVALESGSIEAGKPGDSELLRRILLPRGHDEVMPAIGDPLPKRQIAILRRWIQQGAVWPDKFKVNRHWAYVAPRRPAMPQVQDSKWAKSAIDQFVLHRLQEEGLSPSPEAAPEKRVRRVFLDLIGLPPTPEEVNAFASDPSDERFEKLVDDLLQRPQFGERWARPWLDVARYADSHGFQRDNLRDVWAYRDWVIRALNADMPFDQFTIEQIAGDLLPEATESQKIATGFHRCTPTNVEAGSLPEETRIEQVIDRVNTTGAVWLGSTLECCQCHDHKFDPFPQKDYYRLLAYFNNTEMEADRASKSPSSIAFKGPKMALTNAERDARRAELAKQIAAVKKQQAARRKELNGDLPKWATEFAGSLGDVPESHVLDVAAFESLGPTDEFKRLDDGSILLVGDDPPDVDVYTIKVRADIAGVRAFKLEALRHDSLPGKGPGRGDPVRRNYVLNEFTATLVSAASSEKQTADKNNSAKSAKTPRQTPLKFSSAKADFSQNNWDVAGAINPKPKTGWAVSPKFDTGHWATFILDKPIDIRPDQELVFGLKHQYGAARSIGCFRLSAVTGNLDAESVPDQLVKAVKMPAEKWSKADRKTLLDYRAGQDSQSKTLTAENTKLDNQLKKVTADTTLVMIELDGPRMSTVFDRGDYRKPGEKVEAGTPGILHAGLDGPPTRLTLARWLVDKNNPLVARVTVNRWWAEIFGRGIVPTVEDFGIKGEQASHPKLLDWLAVEFMENDWSMKHVLKTIVLSATYQQSSRVSRELLERDDQNSLLARGPRFRMAAEMIRDNALAISGLIDLKQFGPPIYPYQPNGIWSKVGGTSYEYETSPGSERHRRGLYVILKRGSPYPSFVNFDATARLACTVKRSRTNTPLQALTLLNDPVYVEAAEALAKRVIDEKPDEPLDRQLAHAFQISTSRQPTDTERNALQNLYSETLSASKKEAGNSKAWYSVATVLLNLHETITKD